MIAYKKHKGLSAQGIELLKNPYIYEKLLTIASGVGVAPEEYLIRFEEVLSDTPDKILNIFKKLNF